MENDKPTTALTPEFRSLGASMFIEYDKLLAVADAGASPARLQAQITKLMKEMQRVLREGRRIQRALIATAALTAAFTLSACATIPQPAGATDTQWAGIEADCSLQAAREVPAAVQYTLTPGMNLESQNCHKGACTSSEFYLPPAYNQVDANAPLREDAKTACLARAAARFEAKP